MGNLRRFSISHEQIFEIKLTKIVPYKVTHLSIPYCNISSDRLGDILSQGWLASPSHFITTPIPTFSVSMSSYDSYVDMAENLTQYIYHG